MTQAPHKRKQLTRDDMLKSFVAYYNAPAEAPEQQVAEKPASMVATMQDKQPLMHLYSKYVIWPNAFDRDPFHLPKVATHNKHYHHHN